MSRQTSSRPRPVVRHAAVAALTVLSATGCLPIPRAFPAVPATAGTYRASNGAPVAGVELWLSTRAGDASCRHPAARTVTDSVGRFMLPAATRVERVIWLIPVDPAPQRAAFHVCASGAGESGEGRVQFPTATVTPAAASATVDSVACLEARSSDGRTISCR